MPISLSILTIFVTCAAFCAGAHADLVAPCERPLSNDRYQALYKARKTHLELHFKKDGAETPWTVDGDHLFKSSYSYNAYFADALGGRTLESYARQRKGAG